MNNTNDYTRNIRVQVTKRLSKQDVKSIVSDFVKQRLTFAVSKHNSDYEVWRQILPGDEPRIKNRKDGMTPTGVITEDPDELQERNFICVWDAGQLVEGDCEQL
ncbi:MAG: hypothetical protein P9L94_14795 [Candidatus Hinthialibacter antarcticus]|nr:hypothetical protein [Candidatus Hinthialibacter antarcticus]